MSFSTKHFSSSFFLSRKLRQFQTFKRLWIYPSLLISGAWQVIHLSVFLSGERLFGGVSACCFWCCGRWWTVVWVFVEPFVNGSVTGVYLGMFAGLNTWIEEAGIGVWKRYGAIDLNSCFPLMSMLSVSLTVFICWYQTWCSLLNSDF